jgi:hypothetical protein
MFESRYKGNNKITEHREIFQSERQNSQVNKQTKSVNNRKTGKPAMALIWCQLHIKRTSSWRGVPEKKNDVIKFVSVLRQVGGFLRVLRYPPHIKLTSCRILTRNI